MSKSFPPLPDPDELVERKSAKNIRSMFDAISPTYDFLNHLLSAEMDRLWRRTLAKRVLASQPQRILDVCTGTGDVIFAIAKQAKKQELSPQYVGADFSLAMLRQAHEKSRRQGALSCSPTFIRADTLHLPFPEKSFDLVTVAFGLRNVENLERALQELARVTRPGGQLAVLEFSNPRMPVVRRLYHIYFHHILPAIGWLISGTKAYLYLPKSVSKFPDGKEFATIMDRCGWINVAVTPLTGGIATLYLGNRSS